MRSSINFYFFFCQYDSFARKKDAFYILYEISGGELEKAKTHNLDIIAKIGSMQGLTRVVKKMAPLKLPPFRPWGIIPF